MGNLIVLVVVGVVVFALFKKDSGESKNAKQYLKAMAKFLGQGQAVQPDVPSPQRIDFMYEGNRFIFEHIEEPVSGGKVVHRACLKGESPFPLTMGFTERTRQSIRVNLETLMDLSNPYVSGQIPVPKSLNEFEISTNDRRKAVDLLSDEKIVKIFESFKNRDAVGHPVMSIEIVEGFVILHFHPPGGLQPSLLNLQLNVSSIQDYIRKMLPLLEKLKVMKEKE